MSGRTRYAGNAAPYIAVLAALSVLIAPAPARAQASASPYTSAQRHDAVGRVTGMIAPDPDGAGPLHHAAVRNSYDGAGRLTKVETGELAAWQSEAVAPASWANFTIYRTAETAYDMMGRKVRETLRDGVGGVAGTIRSVTQTSYDSLGRPQCTAIRMNPAAFAALPASACTPGTAGSDGPDRITRNVYDAVGQRLQLREGVGSADEGTEATWAYNLNGQVTAVIDGNGNRAELRYDGHGRQDRWTFPSTTRASAFNDATPATALASAGAVDANDYEAYAYDLNGNRISLRKRDGSVLAYSHDPLGRVAVKVVPERTTGAQALTAAQTRDVYYAYDLRNLQLSARFDSASGEGVTSAYDGFGRLTSSSADMGGVTRTLAYAHDRNGKRTSIAHPDGNAFNTLYDGAGRPRQLLANGAASLAATNYTPYGAPALTLRIGNAVATALGYDGVLRPTVRVHYFTPGISNAVWSYDFNAASQLSAVARDNDAFAWTGHYAVTRPYTTNGLNQYSAAGGASFGYDPNGNLTSDGARTYVYDIENRLVSSSNGAALVYDPLGRLFQVSSPTTGTTKLLYDGDALVAEYDGATGALLRRHVHNVGADVPMVTYEGAGLGTVRQLLADHQGSIVAHADASGAAVQINRYDEYGIPAPTNSGRFQYTGQAWLAELGMYYYKARIYSATLGRFMQTDPIGYQGGINLYAYVRNDPVNWADPTGLAKNCPANDPTCIETPESEQQPGDPPPPSPEETEVQTITVTGSRPPINYGGENEEFFVIGNHQMTRRPNVTWHNVQCPNGANIRAGTTSGIPPGTNGAHSHGDDSEQHPGPRDDNAALHSSGGVAGQMTRNRGFTIRAFPNGTFRTRQTEGPPLSASERAELVRNMQNWERRPDPGPGQPLATRVCP